MTFPPFVVRSKEAGPDLCPSLQSSSDPRKSKEEQDSDSSAMFDDDKTPLTDGRVASKPVRGKEKEKVVGEGRFGFGPI